MKITVFFDWDGDSGVMHPVSLLLDSQSFDWTRSLQICLEAPFEQHDFDEPDMDVLSLIVPDHTLVRLPDYPHAFGIHMPSLRQYADRLLALSEGVASPSDIRRLMLRISDVEDALQYDPNRIRQFGKE